MPELATSGNAFDKRRFSRRGFLGAGIASGFALAACASKPTASGAAGMTAAIDAAEAARPPQWANGYRHADPPAGEDRPGWADRQHADLRQHHPRTTDPGHRRG